MPSKVFIIGYGNPLRGDDGVGHFAAERLQELLRDEAVEVMVGHQLMPEMAEDVSRADLVVFIDACCDRAPGEVSCRAVSPQETPPGAMFHGFDAPGLLGAAQSIYGRAARAMLFSVGAASFEHGDALSPQVARALPELVQQVEDLVHGWLMAKCDHAHGGG